MSPYPRTLGVVAALALGAGTLVSAPAAQAADLDRAPATTLAGAATQLADPVGVTRDRFGRLYVANRDTHKILVFAANATGNAAPVRVISGAATLLATPDDIEVDAAGYIYVANHDADRITVYPPTPGTGAPNEAPVRTITAPANQLDGVAAIEVDAHGGIYAASWSAHTVAYFDSTASGTVAPDRLIAGDKTKLYRPWSLLLRADGSLVVGTENEAVLQFATSDTGNVAPDRVLGGLVSDLGIVSGLGEDARGNLYTSSYTDSTIKVFAKGAVGNATPTVVLKGSHTGLNMPWGIHVDAAGRVTAAQYAGNSVRTYAPLVATPAAPVVTRPSKVRALKVSGKQTAAKRRISWKAPASTGGARITAYRVVVRKGGKTLVAKTVSGSRRSLVVKRSKLRNGKVTVSIRARNAKGYGPTVKKIFRVKK
ncbi:fibronectin type III domain-containing protein [Mumia sp. DW29H23]|uniref:fibronectin type III domain-containing protein n=1 Tax=Mumia sp. DW29H23 TaxID=3421241 RepID=UPI003D683CCE